MDFLMPNEAERASSGPVVVAEHLLDEDPRAVHGVLPGQS